MSVDPTTLLLGIGKLLAAPNIDAAKAAWAAHFEDVDADAELIEAGLQLAGLFFAPAAQAAQYVKIAQTLYDILQRVPAYQLPPGAVVWGGMVIPEKGLFQ